MAYDTFTLTQHAALVASRRTKNSPSGVIYNHPAARCDSDIGTCKLGVVRLHIFKSRSRPLVAGVRFGWFVWGEQVGET